MCQVMCRSGALFVRQPVCREMEFEKLQTDGKERRKETPQTVPRPPFYTRGGGPSLRELPTIEEDGRGTALTPSLRLCISLSLTPLQEHEDRPLGLGFLD
jgi:hypothetical protein